MEVERKKRGRSSNFDTAEILLLADIVSKFKNIIDNKKTDAVTNKNKEAAWIKIAAAFNAAQGSSFRTAKCLKLKYEGLKKNIRKKWALQRQEMYRTGGGTSTAPELDNIDEKVISICSDITGLDARNDSDNLTNIATPEVLISDNTHIEISTDDGFDTKQIVEDNLERENPKDHDGCEEAFEDNQDTGETQEEYVWSTWNPKALKRKKSQALNLNEKVTKAGVTTKLDKLSTAQLELVELQMQIARKEHQIKMIYLQNEEKRKQELHEILINNIRNNNSNI